MKDIGNILREAREAKGVSIKDVSHALKIRLEYLDSIENGDVSFSDKNVYVVGYIRSYASWLGLNGADLTLQFKKTNTELSLPGKVITDSTSFSNEDDESSFPGKILIFFSCLVILAIFIIMINLSTNDDSSSLSLSEYYGPPEYRGFNYEKEKFGKIMLLAKKDVAVNIYYSKEEVVAINLKANDIYFFSDEKNKLISAEDPAMVEIISDDDSGKLLGTLQDYYKKN